MSNLSPNQMLEHVNSLQLEMAKIKKTEVAVGLIADKATGKIYDNGMNVLQIGAIHEFGFGRNPVRSFLRVPFSIKADDISKVIENQYMKIIDNKQTVDKALGLIGITATNISKGAFTTQGYGTWADIQPETKREKGSSQVLIDTGTLRRSVSFEVRQRER